MRSQLDPTRASLAVERGIGTPDEATYRRVGELQHELATLEEIRERLERIRQRMLRRFAATGSVQ